MKKISLIIVLFFCSMIVYSQVNMFGVVVEKTVIEYHFAIRLMPNLNGNLIQVAIKKLHSDDKDDIEFLTLNSWARQLAGYETSKANFDRENLIEKYKIFEIPPEIKMIGPEEVEKYTVMKTESILNNLWRLKYSEYPYFNSEKNSDKGWAKHPDIDITWLPSESQMNILREYEINELSDFIEGEHAIRILKDIRNRDWQNRYIQSAGVYYEEEMNDTIRNY